MSFRRRQSRALQTKLWHRAWELIYPSGKKIKVCFWPCQLKENVWRKKTPNICQINSWIPDTRGCVNLLKQWNHNWYSRCNWSHHLVKLIITHCYSPTSICFLHKPNWCVKWDVVGITTRESFKFLMVALIFAILSGMLLLVYYFPR